MDPFIRTANAMSSIKEAGHEEFGPWQLWLITLVKSLTQFLLVLLLAPVCLKKGGNPMYWMVSL